MGRIRVLLVDDHPVVRDGVRSLLDRIEDISLVGEASSGEEALRMVEEVSPEIMLLDMELPDISGTQVAREVKKKYPYLKVLAFSAHDDPVYVRGVLESGAAGYLMKDEAPEALLEAVRGVALGEQGWVSRKIAGQMTAWVQAGDRNGSKLTSREEEVLRLLVEGKTNSAIAFELDLSEKTIEKYLQGIFTKLEVSSRVEAAVKAVKDNLV